MNAAEPVRTVCCYCGVGCGLLVDHDGTRILGVRGDPDHPANRGRLCTKGATLHLAAAAGGRALHPEIRTDRAAPRRRASWDEALDHVAERFAATIEAHGPDSVAFYLSGQFLTEDYYVYNKLARALVGTNNLDTNSRLCMSSAVMGYKATLGADSVPACYDDIDRAGCILIAGSNTAVAHPVVFRRVEEARARAVAPRLVVIDPRRTETAAAADLHLALRPGTDVALFHAMLHVMLAEGLIDAGHVAGHTTGFEALAALAGEMPPGRAARICGLDAGDIARAARWFAAPGGTVSLYCQGLNQSVAGTEKNAALIGLHLACGQIGRPGAGPLSLTGQPNAMGGREVGGMATLLSAHRDLGSAADREEMARFWGVPAIPARPGLTAVELFEAVARGEVRAVWIGCTNPAQSLPDVARVRAALSRAELVVVQDAYRDIETAAFADVLLPAASWGEKDGTMTNSERCIARVRAAVSPPGEARADWEIGVDFARRLAQRLGRDDLARLFAYTSPEQVWNEHRETTRGRDCDITGLSYARLDADGPVQWPFPEGAATGQARLYEDGRYATADGRARFVASAWRPVAEPTDQRHDIALTTGRLRDQWHGMSRTGMVARLYAHAPEPALAMHPAELARRGLGDGDLVRVESRRGGVVLPVQGTADVAEGRAFLPMHWGGRFLAGGGVNTLTVPAVDPASRQPELKHAAVSVTPVAFPWRLHAVSVGDADARLARVSALLDRFAHASCGLAGRDHAAVVFRAASPEPFDTALLAELDAALGLDAGSPVTFDDAGRGVHQRAILREGRLDGFRLAGDVRPATWLAELATSRREVGILRAVLLAPLAAPPAGAAARGRVVCNCLDVAEAEIVAAIAGGAGLASLQQNLHCGTECGSCVPELRRLLDRRESRGMTGGCVWLIGAGPGDPELLTLKAVRAIGAADVVLVDDLVHPDVLAHVAPHARVLSVGKRGPARGAGLALGSSGAAHRCRSTPQALIERLMLRYARRGLRVARIKGGDPCVFGRAAEERERLQRAGIRVEIVSGVSAGLAGPAAAGICVTTRGVAPAVTFVTGHSGSGMAPDWTALARSGATLVVFMPIANLERITAALRAGGMRATTAAALVENATTPAQRVIAGDIATIAARAVEYGIASPAILVVGEVARQADTAVRMLARVA